MNYLILSSTGRHEFTSKENALDFMNILNSFEEKYCFIVIQNDTFTMQPYNCLHPIRLELFELPRIQSHYENEFLIKLMNKNSKVNNY